MRIPVNPVFNTPENHLHEYCLRTGPSTPDTAIGNGKQNDEHHQGDHPDKKEIEILWPELNAKDGKGSVKKIEQQELLSIDLDKRG